MIKHISKFYITYNVFIWILILIFNLTFAVNLWHAIFYIITSIFLAIIISHTVFKRIAVKFLDVAIFIVFGLSFIFQIYFKWIDAYLVCYYFTYCLVVSRFFIYLSPKNLSGYLQSKKQDRDAQNQSESAQVENTDSKNDSKDNPKAESKETQNIPKDEIINESEGKNSYDNHLTQKTKVEKTSKNDFRGLVNYKTAQVSYWLSSKVAKTYERTTVKILLFCLMLMVIPFSYFYLTNPFQEGSIFKFPYRAYFQDRQIGLMEEADIHSFNSPFAKSIGYLKSGGHIFNTALFDEPGFDTDNIDEITKQSYRLRFGQDTPYIISGGHFSVFYLRSLGIFYHPTMDPFLDYTPSQQNPNSFSQKEREQYWVLRQQAYLKTLAFALKSFENCGDLYTTIVPLGENSITCINIYHYPSDSLYSLLLAFQNLIDNSEYLKTYYGEDYAQKPGYMAQNTSIYTSQMLQKYRVLLQKLWQKYSTKVYDAKTGLIKKDLEISSTKDIGLQQGSFYDNVIYWKTWKLMNDLELLENLDKVADQSKTSPQSSKNNTNADFKSQTNSDESIKNQIKMANKVELDAYKKRIIDTFWVPDKGYFNEDQSTGCRAGCYSSDWLVVLLTGFLNPRDREESFYYQKSLDYIIQNKIDQPFGLRYQNDDRPEKTYPLVQITNHEYAGSGIWSYWGMEYIKALKITSRSIPNFASRSTNGTEPKDNFNIMEPTGLKDQINSGFEGEKFVDNLSQKSILYQQTAEHQIQKYNQNIQKYKAFPEVYNSRGELMSEWMYRSVVKTGWIVGFRQSLEVE